VARVQVLDDPLGTVDRGAFLVAGDQEGDRAAMLGALGDKASTAVTIAARPLFMSAAPRP
jgi:hypothetical protein